MAIDLIILAFHLGDSSRHFVIYSKKLSCFLILKRICISTYIYIGDIGLAFLDIRSKPNFVVSPTPSMTHFVTRKQTGRTLDMKTDRLYSDDAAN